MIIKDHTTGSGASRARMIRLKRKSKRSKWIADVLTYLYLLFQVCAGGVSGLLIGALILEWWKGPNHPFFVLAKETLQRIFGG